MEKKKFISTSELANMLGISRIAIFKKIRKGEIKATRIGRNYAIPMRAISVLSGTTTEAKKSIIKKAVKKTVTEYGEVLKRLGNE